MPDGRHHGGRAGASPLPIARLLIFQAAYDYRCIVERAITPHSLLFHKNSNYLLAIDGRQHLIPS